MKWLSIIIIIAIILVLADGFLRKFRSRSNLRVKLEKNVPAADLDDEPLGPEFPSGGARTVSRGTREPAFSAREADDVLLEEDSLYDADYHDGRQTADEGDDGRHWRDEQEQAAFAAPVAQIDPAEPIESVEMDPEEPVEIETIEEPVAEAPEVIPEPLPEETMADGNAEEQEFSESADDRDWNWDEDTDDDIDDDAEDADVDDTAGMVAEKDDAPAAHRGHRGGHHDGDHEEKRRSGQVFQNELFLDGDDEFEDESLDDTDGDADDAEVDVEEVIVINVMAPSGATLAGKEMLQVLLKQGMRLGNMSIFHRHADSNGNGPIMFSMANMVKPGTFDMAQMDDFSTPGVSLFLQLPGRHKSFMQSFEHMLETANALKETLGGVLKDENRSVLTRQTVEHYRQRIRDFELQQLSRK